MGRLHIDIKGHGWNLGNRGWRCGLHHLGGIRDPARLHGWTGPSGLAGLRSLLRKKQNPATTSPAWEAEEAQRTAGPQCSHTCRRRAQGRSRFSSHHWTRKGRWMMASILKACVSVPARTEGKTDDPTRCWTAPPPQHTHTGTHDGLFSGSCVSMASIRWCSSGENAGESGLYRPAWFVWAWVRASSAASAALPMPPFMIFMMSAGRLRASKACRRVQIS